MNALLLAMVWGAVALIGFAALSKFERSSRLVVRAQRPALAPRRALWGGDPVHPPSRALSARMLAGFARLARPRSAVADHQVVLRMVARGLGATALFMGLAMLPFVGSWGGGEGAPLVLFDPKQGLALIALILLLIAFARISVGLAERSPWSRMGSARQSSRAIASMALLARSCSRPWPSMPGRFGYTILCPVSNVPSKPLSVFSSRLPRVGRTRFEHGHCLPGISSCNR